MSLICFTALTHTMVSTAYIKKEHSIIIKFDDEFQNIMISMFEYISYIIYINSQLHSKTLVLKDCLLDGTVTSVLERELLL